MVLVADEDRVLGAIAVADRLRTGADASLAALRRRGITSVALLTGDNPATARAVADALGDPELIVKASLLPAEKVLAVRELQASHGPVLMVGDGINDAPAPPRRTSAWRWAPQGPTSPSRPPTSR